MEIHFGLLGHNPLFLNNLWLSQLGRHWFLNTCPFPVLWCHYYPGSKLEVGSLEKHILTDSKGFYLQVPRIQRLKKLPQDTHQMLIHTHMGHGDGSAGMTLVTRSDDLSSSLGPRRKRSNHCRMSSDFHTCAMTHERLLPHTNKNSTIKKLPELCRSPEDHHPPTRAHTTPSSPQPL